jgi:putative ABC transport system permease protein
MGILDAIQTGLTELLSHKMRSMLTMLGVIFGVAAVIAMVSIGDGGRQTMMEQIRQMGIDVLHIKRAVISGELLQKAQEKSPNGLTYANAKTIREVCTFAKQIVPVREVFADVKVGEKPVPVKVVGTTAGYDEVTRSEMATGRFLSDEDVARHISVCVLGATAKRELFGFDDPIGKTVRAGKRIFRVVGLMAPKEVSSGKAFSSLRDMNLDIYIPITVSITDYQLYSQQAMPTTMSAIIQIFRKLMKQQNEYNAQLTEVIVQVESEAATLPTESLVRATLNRLHGGIRDYEIVVPAELIKQSQQTQKIFNIVMAAIASISLLVGGIGIMNIMLATVTQRTREIGIRRCIGATQWDIIRQFMLEALVITCVGGLIGVALGIAGARAISEFANWRTVVSMQAVALSFGVSALVGVVFGLYPAIRAASVDPIEALRSS